MLRIIKQHIIGLKYPLFASLTLSFASLGDAFLYPFLPQNAELMQIPVVWIGILLSINRFIRILFNPLVAKIFAKYGVRQSTIVAAIIAVISTFGYGLGWGLLSLLVFRILWGMAFAILRISVMAYAFEHERIGFSFGTTKGIQELGPLIALWIGPILLQYFPAEIIFFVLAILSVPAVLYAWQLPELNYESSTNRIFNISIPSLSNLLTFLASFVVEGMLIIVLGVFLTKHYYNLNAFAITSLAAGYLVFRRVCFILFSSVSGVIADRIGFEKVFNGSLLFIIIGLVLLLAGKEMIGLVTIFIFNSVNSTMAPGYASDKQKDKILAITKNASWRDVGAAIGALIGGLLLSGDWLLEVFIIITFILFSLLLLNYRTLKFN